MQNNRAFLLIVVWLINIAVPQLAECRFIANYSFKAEECGIKRSFQDDNQAPLGSLFASGAECVQGQGLLSGFPSARNGVSLRNPIATLQSDWTVADLLDGFVGTTFTIAAWYTLATNDSFNDQTIFQIDNFLRITPIGAQMLIGGNILTGNTTLLLPPKAFQTKQLLVFTVGPKRANLWRRTTEAGSVWIADDFALPETFMTTEQIVIPRMSSWNMASRARITFRGDLFALRFFETNIVNPDTLFKQGPPDYQPRCPSVRDAVQQTLEHSPRVTFNLYNATSGSGNGVSFKVESLPLSGTLLDDNGKPITMVPMLAHNLSFIPGGANLMKNDSFLVRAVNDSDDSCVSAYRAQISISIIAVNDPPVPSDVYVVGPARMLTSIVLGGIDPDGNRTDMRGGFSHVALEWSSTTFEGNLFALPCDNLTRSGLLPTPLNGTSYNSPNGTGWPVEFCYMPTYDTLRFSRSSGMPAVGTDSFFFRLIDDLGLPSMWSGIVRIDVGNPAQTYSASGLLQLGTEETPLSIQVAFSDVDVKETWIVTGPAHGKLLTQSMKQFAGKVPDAEGEVIYMPDVNFAGDDEFTFRIRDDSGYLSPPLLMRLRIANTYDPSFLVITNNTVKTRSFERIGLGVSLTNWDYDEYPVQVTVALQDPLAGMLSIRNLNSTVTVSRGSSCIDVGCHDSLVFSGLPSYVCRALSDLEFTATTSLDNSLMIELSDLPPGKANWTQVDQRQVTVLSLDSTVWGSKSAERGSVTVGAAIIGSLLSFALVFGRGLWTLTPIQKKKRVLAFSKRLPCHSQDKPKHGMTRMTLTRAVLRPPSTSWKSSPSPGASSEGTVPSTPSFPTANDIGPDRQHQHFHTVRYSGSSSESGSFSTCTRPFSQLELLDNPRGSFEMPRPPSAFIPSPLQVASKPSLHVPSHLPNVDETPRGDFALDLDTTASTFPPALPPRPSQESPGKRSSTVATSPPRAFPGEVEELDDEADPELSTLGLV